MFEHIFLLESNLIWNNLVHELVHGLAAEELEHALHVLFGVSEMTVDVWI